MLPLLPGKADDHRKYCRLAMHENKEQTTQACRKFGQVQMSKWIQHSAKADYILYDVLLSIPVEEGRKEYLALKDNPKAIAATQTLRSQTGLAFEELSPKVQCLYTLEIDKEP